MRVRILLVLVLLAALAAPAAATPQDEPSFGRRALAPKVRPTQAVVADLDADGNPDVVTAVGLGEDNQEATRAVSVMLGAPGGALRPARRYQLPYLANSLRVLDATGDGVLDVVAHLAAPSNLVVVLAGAGDGTLGPATPLLTQRVDAMAIGSLRSQGALDAAVIRNQVLQVWPGTGPRRFGDPMPLDIAHPQQLWAADPDGDGADELLVATGDRRLLLLRGLAVVAQVEVPNRVMDVAVADATGDGRRELVVATFDGSVIVYDGGLRVLRQERSGPGITSVAASDLDGDGMPELVAGTRGPELAVWAAGRSASVPISRAASDLVPADLDGDGRDELLVVEPTASIIEVLENPLAPDQPAPVRVPTFGGGWDTHVIDVDGDGDDDMVAANCWTFIGDTGGSFRAEVYRNDGTGRMAQTTTLSAVLPSACGAGVGDVNGDGAADVLMADYYSGAVHQWLGNGDGTFLPPIVVSACYLASMLTLADLNGDGTDDAVVACRTPGVLAVLAGTPAGLVRTPVAMPYGFGPETYLMDTGDLDGDGDLDVVVGSFNQTCITLLCVLEPSATGRPVTVFLGGGDLTLAPPRSYRPEGPFFAMAVADVDGDGFDDIITPRVFDDVVEVHHGSPTATLGRVTTTPSYDYPWGVAADDVTGDGHVDLVMSHGPLLVSITSGNGDGTFAVPTGFATQEVTGDVFTGRFGGDERRDVLVVGPGMAEVLLQR